MLNMEELLNQISVELTVTVQFLSKIDPDYAYGQIKLSKETSRNWHQRGENSAGFIYVQKRILQTREYSYDIPGSARSDIVLLHIGVVGRYNSSDTKE